MLGWTGILALGLAAFAVEVRRRAARRVPSHAVEPEGAGTIDRATARKRASESTPRLGRLLAGAPVLFTAAGLVLILLGVTGPPPRAGNGASSGVSFRPPTSRLESDATTSSSPDRPKPATDATAPGQDIALLYPGDVYFVGILGPPNGWNRLQGADSGDTLTFLVRILDVGTWHAARDVSVATSLPQAVVTAYESRIAITCDNGSHVEDACSVVLAHPGVLRYVPGSTALYDSEGHLERRLPDGIVNGTLRLGDIPSGDAAAKWLIFSVRVR